MARPARNTTCRDCQADTLTGVDADVCGIQTTVDRQPVDSLGEFIAIATGRRTYTLRAARTAGSHSRELDERTAAVIHAGRTRGQVHAEHRCGQPLPAAVALVTRSSEPARHVVLEGAPF